MNEQLQDLPDEVIEAMAIQKAKLAEKIEAFGASLAKKREEAIQGRASSGIEDDWTADEEAYQGVDDTNRESVLKPSTPNGGFQTNRKSMAGRSTVYLNITRPYVDAAAARVADMTLPNDETNWGIRPTPISQGKFQPTPVAQAIAQPNVDPAMQGMPQPPAPTVDPAEAIQDQARAACEKAKTQLEDWLVQCQWHSEVRKVLENCARLGTGILKGPTPAKKYNRVANSNGGMLAMAIEQTIAPESKSIDLWKFYPDPACGEDIHNGSYVWEMDEITAKQLRELKGIPGYLDEQIDKALELGPQKGKTNKSLKFKEKINDADKFEIWYFYGLAEREDLEAANVDIPLDGDVSVPAIITMVNDVPIKAALNPLDSGDFPYDVLPWQRRSGMPWGMGVARQINTPQRMLNAATRNMMDNAGFSAGPQLIVKRDAIEPADGVWTITPRKIWFVREGADVQAAAQAFIAVNIPTMQQELSNIIQFALKMAEDVTGLPMLMQGSQGTAPDTVGGMTIVNNNANVVLRRIVRTIDDKLTEPHIRRYYEYLMLYGEDEEAKGDFQIDARGSTALIERDFQNNEAAQILQMSLNPAFGISPKQAMTEYLKSRRFDAKRFEPTDEEKKAAQNVQPPPMPQVEVAKIRAETDKEIAAMKGQVELKKVQTMSEGDVHEIETRGAIEMKLAQTKAEADIHRTNVDTDRDRAYVESETEKNRIMANAKERELEMKYALAQLEYANKHQITLDQVKAKLSTESAKINLQRELAHLDSHTKQVLKPPVEPAGRAKPGEAYQA
jgi:hypothetical protein